MSTSLLYHGFGIVGYLYIRSEYREGNVIFAALLSIRVKIKFKTTSKAFFR